MANRLKELRKDKGLTQSEVAKIINTTQSQYGKYENNKANISLKNSEILANYFGVSTAYLLGVYGNPDIKTNRLTNFQSLVKDGKLSLKEISAATGVTFENKVRVLRKDLDKTLEEVAKETGISRSAISSYENGYSIPKKENAKKLADYYGVSISYLLGIDDNLF